MDNIVVKKPIKSATTLISAAMIETLNLRVDALCFNPILARIPDEKECEKSRKE